MGTGATVYTGAYLASSVRRLSVRDVALSSDTMVVPVTCTRYELKAWVDVSWLNMGNYNKMGEVQVIGYWDEEEGAP